MEYFSAAKLKHVGFIIAAAIYMDRQFEKITFRRRPVVTLSFTARMSRILNLPSHIDADPDSKPSLPFPN